MRARRSDESYGQYRLNRLKSYIRTQLALKGRLVHDSGMGTRLFRRRPDLLPKDPKTGKPMTSYLKPGNTYRQGP